MASNKPYTYHLPYSVRRNLCNILDADQSWRTVGGDFMRMDATQLVLIGQAYLRNASPTEELLRKIDSANVRIIDLCHYLEHFMKHKQASDVLRAYMTAAINEQQSTSQNPSFESSLNTPTPSFTDIQPAALMNSTEFELLVNSENYNNNPNDWNNISTSGSQATADNAQQNESQATKASSQQRPRCHKTGLLNLSHHHDDDQHNNNAICNANPKGQERCLPVWRSKAHKLNNDQDLKDQLKLIMQIPYKELEIASDKFSDANQLGKGGFAKVYCGFWKGTHVAIKRLCKEHMDQALNETLVLSRHKIDNILPLYGVSIDGPEACLVSQFMVNGSLEDRLACKNYTPPLSWQQRAMIAEGVAKGLYYLHTVWPGRPLIHGDVKPANVLLDAQLVPKLADFGMARQLYRGNALGHDTTDKCSTHCTVSSVQGTSVYLPHEFLVNKKLSEAVDVYSYGIVMLEMATGKQALVGKQPLIELVEDEMNKVHTSGNNSQLFMCRNLKDPRLDDDNQVTSVGLRIWFELLLRLGINCSKKHKSKRPAMGQVLNHFAQFRQYLASSPPDTPIMDHILDQTINSTAPTTTTAATSRTLTPELSVFDPLKHPLANVPLANRDKPHSALMSVEEEELRHQQGHQFKNNAGAVEDMIPLLTELGFESSQPP